MCVCVCVFSCALAPFRHPLPLYHAFSPTSHPLYRWPSCGSLRLMRALRSLLNLSAAHSSWAKSDSREGSMLGTRSVGEFPPPISQLPRPCHNMHNSHSNSCVYCIHRFIIPFQREVIKCASYIYLFMTHTYKQTNNIPRHRSNLYDWNRDHAYFRLHAPTTHHANFLFCCTAWGRLRKIFKRWMRWLLHTERASVKHEERRREHACLVCTLFRPSALYNSVAELETQYTRLRLTTFFIPKPHHCIKRNYTHWGVLLQRHLHQWRIVLRMQELSRDDSPKHYCQEKYDHSSHHHPIEATGCASRLHCTASRGRCLI